MALHWLALLTTLAAVIHCAASQSVLPLRGPTEAGQPGPSGLAGHHQHSSLHLRGPLHLHLHKQGDAAQPQQQGRAQCGGGCAPAASYRAELQTSAELQACLRTSVLLVPEPSDAPVDTDCQRCLAEQASATLQPTEVPPAELNAELAASDEYRNLTLEAARSRRLSIDAAPGGAFVFSFFPDTSVLQYQVVVEGLTVSNPGALAGLRLPVPSWAEAVQRLPHFSLRNESAALRVAAAALCHPSQQHGGFCRPLLCFNLPFASDYAIYHHQPGSSAAGPALNVGLAKGERLVLPPGGSAPGLIVRPKPGVEAAFGAGIAQSAYVIARLVGAHAVVTVDTPLAYDDEAGGWPLVLDMREPGQYQLEVAVDWYYGLNEVGTRPLPHKVGAYMAHYREPCGFARSLVDGAPLPLVIPPPANDPSNQAAASNQAAPAGGTGGGLAAPVTRKCGRADGMAPGRWLARGSPPPPCEPPMCTGEHDPMVTAEWSGAQDDLLWVPYGCVPHLYSPQQIARCAVKQGIKWIHVLGDSVDREFPTAIYGRFPEEAQLTKAKFHEADALVGNGSLRLSFNSWYIVNPGPDFADVPLERNWQEDRAVLDALHLSCAGIGEPPSVLVLSPAMVYSAWHMTEAGFRLWVSGLAAYLAHALRACQPPPRVLWRLSQAVYSQAHAGTAPLSAQRVRLFSQIAEQVMRDAGMELFDAFQPTRSRWTSSYDGVHYLRCGGDLLCHSNTAHMLAQTLLNVIFDDCTGE